MSYLRISVDRLPRRPGGKKKALGCDFCDDPAVYRAVVSIDKTSKIKASAVGCDAHYTSAVNVALAIAGSDLHLVTNGNQ